MPHHESNQLNPGEPDGMESLRTQLAEILSSERTEITRALFLEYDPSAAGDQVVIRAPFLLQAERFLGLLSGAIRRSQTPSPPLPYALEAALQQEFPLVYRIRVLHVLVSLLYRRLTETVAPAPSHDACCCVLMESLAYIELDPLETAIFTEGIGRLNQLSWELNSLHDEDAIIRCALREGAALVEADSCALWLWDNDQQLPMMMVTLDEDSTTFSTPGTLLRLMRQTIESGCAFSIDPGESEPGWPEQLQGRPVAFIPLPAHDGCLGILTVHHREQGRFTHDHILLLSSLGNLVATALQNVRLYENERHLVNLLQSSIRQVVQTTSGKIGKEDEFVKSMLQVAGGLTKADAVGVLLVFNGKSHNLVSPSTGLMARSSDKLLELARHFEQELESRQIPLTGILDDLTGLPDALHENRQFHYALTAVRLNDKPAGVVYALSPSTFSEDQAMFLHTITEQIVLGLENIQKSDSIQRLLFQMSNVNFVTEQISSSQFDTRHIMATISKAASQALGASVAICGWFEQDGTVRIWPGTSVGLPAEIQQALVDRHYYPELKLPLTDNHIVIRYITEQRGAMTSQMLEPRAGAVFPFLTALGITNWLCVPMLVKGQVRGMLLVAGSKLPEYGTREIALLTTYAHQAALAMENSLLYAQGQQQLAQMQLLYIMARAVSSTLDLNAINHELLQAATVAMQAQAALISLVDDDTSQQRIAASKGVDADPLHCVRVAREEGILGTVAHLGSPISSINLRSDGRDSLLHDLAIREDWASSLTVPLAVHQRVLGTLTVLMRETRDFSRAEIDHLQALATEAAVAIQNARLYGLERARSNELRALVSDASRRLFTTLDLITELITITQTTEPDHRGMERTAARIAAIAAVQAGMAEDTPTFIDMAAVMDTYVHHVLSLSGTGKSLPKIRVTGARLLLPVRLAMPVMVFIDEWIAAFATQSAGKDHPSLIVGFQQSGKDVHVALQYAAEWTPQPSSLNSVIIDAVQRMLHGTYTESPAQGKHEVSLSFTLPDDDLLLSPAGTGRGKGLHGM